MTIRQAARAWVTAGAATTDQVLAAVTLLGRKIDTLMQETGIIVTQQDDHQRHGDHAHRHGDHADH